MNTRRTTSGSGDAWRRDATGRKDTRSKATSSPALYHNRSKGEPITLHDGKRNVCVGTLFPDGVFLKHLKPQHILRTPAAI